MAPLRKLGCLLLGLLVGAIGWAFVKGLPPEPTVQRTRIDPDLWP